MLLSSLLLAISVLASSDDPGFAPLNDLLRNVTFNIPAIAFSADGVDATIESTVCSHLHVGLLEASYTPHAASTPPASPPPRALGALAFGAEGVGLKCTASVVYKAPLGVHGTLGVQFGVEDSNLAATAAFFDDAVPATTPTVPTRVEFPASECAGTFHVDGLKFSGGVAGWILELLKSLIGSEVEKELNSAVCGVLSSALPPLVNPLLLNVSRLLRDAAMNPPPPFGATPTPRRDVPLPASLTSATSAATVDWAQNPVLALVDWAVDNVLGDDASLAPSAQVDAATRRLALVDPLVTHLTNGTGWFQAQDLDVMLIHFDDALTNTTIGLRSFQIGGLDTINRLDLLEPYEANGEATGGGCADLAFSTWSRVGAKRLNMSLGLWLDLGPGSNVAHGAGTYHLEIEIGASMAEVEATAIVLSALQREVLEHMRIGALLTTPAACALSLLWAGDAGLNITGLELELSEFNGPFLSGFISGGLDTLIDNAVSAVKQLYGPVLWAATSSLADGAGRELLNGGIKLAREFGGALLTCDSKQPPGPNAPHLVNWETSAALALVSDAISEGPSSALGVGGWLMDINSLIAQSSPALLHRVQDVGGLSDWSVAAEPVAESTELNRDGTLFALDLDFAGLGHAKLAITNVSLAGLDSLEKLTLLRADEGSNFTLANEVTFGGADADHNGGKTEPLALRLGVKMDFVGVGENDGVTIHDNVLIDVAMTRVSLNAPISAKLDESLALDLNMSALFLSEILPPGDALVCLLSAFEAFEILDFHLEMGNLALELKCVGGASGCSSPGLHSGEMQALLRSAATQKHLTQFVNNVLGRLTNGGASSPLVRGLNGQLSSAVARAPGRCSAGPTLPPTAPAEPALSPAAISAAVGVGLGGSTLLILIIGGALVLTAWRHIKRRRDANPSVAGERLGIARRLQAFAASLAVPILARNPEESAPAAGRIRGELGMRRCDGSLICHRSLPCALRLAVPVFLALTVVCYITAHTHVGATVDLNVALVGDAPIKIPSLFAFSLGNTISDMWQAGVYPLAFLIALLSGGWPYLKVLLMFFCWVAPFSRDAFVLTPEVRARLLRWLDALGKWSLIDAYLLILFMVAFRFHIEESLDDGSGKGGYVWVVADVIVHPAWGFHGFMVATIASLISTHIIIAAQRKADESDALALGEDDNGGDVMKVAPRSRVASEPELEAPLLLPEERGERGSVLQAMTVTPSGPSLRERCVRWGNGLLCRVGADGGGSRVALRTLACGCRVRWLKKHENKRFYFVIAAGAGENEAQKSGALLGGASPVSPSSSEMESDAMPPRLVAAVNEELMIRHGTVRCGGIGQAAVVVMLACSLVLLIAGIFAKSFGFAFKGLAGSLLGGNNEAHYSLWSLATTIGSNDPTVHDGVWFIQIVYIVFAIVMPVLLLAALTVLWLVPLTLQWQTALYSISEILYAWSTIDVITLSVVAAQLQIKQFVAFIVGNHCNAINVAIATLADGVFGPGELAELCTLFDLRAF